MDKLLLARRQCLLLGLNAALAVAASAQAAPVASAARRPLAHFARLPQLESLSLSPDGTQLAAVMNQGDRSAVVLRPLEGDGRLRVLLANDNKKFHFNWLRWVGPDRLLASIRYPARRGFVGTLETRLLSLTSDGAEPLQLSFHEASAGLGIGGRAQQLQDQVIDWLPGDGKHVLVQVAEGEAPEPAVMRVNLEDGSRKVVKGPERRVWRWWTDAQHRVRLGLRKDLEQSRSEILIRDPDGGDWRTLWQAEHADELVWPLGFDPDPQRLYVLAPHEGRSAVFRVQLDAPGLPRELLLAHPLHDIEGQLLRSPGSGAVLGLRGGGDESESENAASERSELWSPPWQALMRELDRALAGWSLRLLDLSADEQRYLVYASGNGKPGRYFVGDRRNGRLQLVGETYPELKPDTLAGKQEASVTARDGTRLPVYLTLPRGRSLKDEGPSLPLLLLPHGGPAGRDDSDFDPWAEFLADRGYAVLQVNFRGSDGYGAAFRKAGAKRWGLEMQDDLEDAARWAQAQGLGAAGRVGIVGGSYGGYAALMGVVKTPELYRCAVSFAGVSDLPALIAHEADYLGGRAAALNSLGDPSQDAERLRATSPALQAERVKAPVLLIHGSADRIVPANQSQAMARALQRAGKTVRHVELEGADHSLSRQPDRLRFFEELERFLDQHLPAGKP